LKVLENIDQQLQEIGSPLLEGVPLLDRRNM
jgi:hypothetical protein